MNGLMDDGSPFASLTRTRDAKFFSSLIPRLSLLVLFLTGLLFLAGCGSEKNEKTPEFDGDQHTAGWLPAGHRDAARADETVCTECHGADFSGGISKVSCSQCHLGGVNSVHPLVWSGQTVTAHGGYVAGNGNTQCANAFCHGTTLSGVAQSGPSCTSCHLGGVGSVHPASWGTGSQVVPNHAPYASTNGATACSNVSCHGTNLAGGAGPACSLCHLNGSPLTFTGCTSCHSKPPAGSVYPNIAGAHAAHNALPSITNVCDTCHSGAGSGTVNHDAGSVTVQFLNVYSAKSGTVVRNPDGTCSKVSCHGGQTTPSWYSGTSIDINTQCTSCHTYGTAEYNSYVSGQHAFHVDQQGIACVICHDTSKLGLGSNHFSYLNTPAIEGPASATLNSSLNFAGGSCAPSCHSYQSW
jgi:predicted CxxxxCH...CXXCH cytochrome family protein